MQEFKRVLGEGVRLMLAIQVPAMVGLIILARPVIRVLLEGGRFSGTDTNNAALATVCFTLGLCSFAGVKIFAQAFYALQEEVVDRCEDAAKTIEEILIENT